MLSGRQLIKLTTIKDRYEPVLYIELSDLKLEFPEVQAKKIILPEIQKDAVSIGVSIYQYLLIFECLGV